MMTLFACAISYIYVINGLKCSPALGLCSVATNVVLAYTTYMVLLSITNGKNRSKEIQEKSAADFTQQRKEEKRDGSESPVDIGTKKANDKDEATVEKAKAECKAYMEKVIAPLFPETVKSNLLQLVDDYANGIIRCTPIMIGVDETKGLRPIDFYHLIWNIWSRLNTLDRRASCRFIKNAFPTILDNTNEETIYRKMNDTYAKCTIENITKLSKGKFTENMKEIIKSDTCDQVLVIYDIEKMRLQ